MVRGRIPDDGLWTTEDTILLGRLTDESPCSEIEVVPGD